MGRLCGVAATQRNTRLPVCAAFCSQPTLGSTLRFAWLVSRASAAGGVFACCLLSICGSSPAAVYSILALASPVIVVPAFLPVTTRLGWATFVGGVTTALWDGPNFDPTLSLRLALSSVLGAASAVVFVLPPWPTSRAHAASDVSIGRAGACLASAARALTHSPRLPASAAAASFLAEAAAARDTAAAFEVDLAWEGVDACSRLAPRLRLLRAAEVALRGCVLAADQRRASDSWRTRAAAQCAVAGRDPGGGATGARATALRPSHPFPTAFTHRVSRDATRSGARLPLGRAARGGACGV